MKATFDNSVSVLVKAYLNNTLEHSKCSACAVGNLVAASMGTKPKLDDDGYYHFRNFENEDSAVWQFVFMTGTKRQVIEAHNYYGTIKDQIDKTGYSWRELARIEFAFESAPGRCDNGLDDTWVFNGLMAVVDVLADIHGINLTAKEEAKKLFVKSLKS